MSVYLSLLSFIPENYGIYLNFESFYKLGKNYLRDKY